MNNSAKKITLIIVSAIILSAAAAALLIIAPFKPADTEKNGVPSAAVLAQTDRLEFKPAIPEDHFSDDLNANIFTFKQIDSDKDTVTAVLALSGEISICRYSASIIYDCDCLELVDYDEELSAYSPVVYPGKDEEGKILPIDERGQINLEWANANNLTRDGEIITLVFRKTDKFKTSSRIGLNLKGISIFKDGLVEDTEYNSRGIELEAK